MVWLALLLAGAVGAASPVSAPAAPQLYRVELVGGQSAWSIGKPKPNGALLLFRHYPDGALMSVPSRDVKKIVATSARPEEGKRLRPGEAIEIEASGGESAAGGAAVAGKPAVPLPDRARTARRSSIPTGPTTRTAASSATGAASPSRRAGMTGGPTL